ncbi:MAG: phosphoribosylaminoimidazolesuccinocarboxamide synthase, partial [Candidatus Bipolaricaulia bacterium]
MGSVKNLFVQKNPTRDELGLGEFVFSDRYSVFDWGKMPDLIPDKGKVLAMMGGYNFELLEREEVKTHYLGLLEAGGSRDPAETGSLSSPTNKMSIRLAHEPEIRESESGYQYEDLSDWNNFLIPLEIVFRNYIPLGSSIRRRYEPGDVGLELGEWPEEEIELEGPLVEYSTKLERQDRYLSREEAFEISGLTEE